MSPIEGIAKGAAGLGQVAMAINSVRSMINTLSDDSASLGEKITASFMAISMTIPSVIGAYKNLSSVINAVATAINAQTIS